MKTLADFKRALKPGSKWHARYMPTNKDIGIRTVLKLQGNAVCMETEKGVSWLYFPKASEFRVNEKNEIEIWAPECNEPNFKYPRKLLLIYKQII